MIDRMYLATYSWDSFLPMWAWIEARTSSDSQFSMGKHINCRLVKCCEEGPRWRAAYPEDEPEIFLLADVIMWYLAARRAGCFHDEPLDMESTRESRSDDELTLGFRAALAKLEHFYILRARVIFCTPASTASRILRGFHPHFILVEDASLMTEMVYLNAIMWHHTKASKIILTGDNRQASNCIVSWDSNQHFESAKISLFYRFQAASIPCAHLFAQYRMAPDISRFITEIFYRDERSKEMPNCEDRQAALLFRQIMSRKAPGCASSNVYFISVKKASLWRRRNVLARINPEYVCCAAKAVQDLIDGGMYADQILIVCDSAEERSALRGLLRAIVPHDYRGVDIRSVDSVPGCQKEIVILLTGRPARFSADALIDAKRQCLAMSRAMDGLIIIGQTGLEHAGCGWPLIVNYSRRMNTMICLEGRREMLEETLGIPNKWDYEKLRAN
ncbi:AAA domain-containing protein [Aspergillus karnatakaensis]|uniref:AAA domain-containing protein n=1 Tax=Aspergillus karnatakaensis TaxID=1810916 RepID=UPI003CCD578A